MKQLTARDRILLLLTGLLAAYQIMFGISGLKPIPMIAYTTGFGILLIAGLLVTIMGFEILDAPGVVVTASVIPLAFSTGLVAEQLPRLTGWYTLFTGIGLTAILLTRLTKAGHIGVYVLGLVHGISGMIIFILPIYLSLTGLAPARFLFVGIGGAWIGMGGIFLTFLKIGKPLLDQQTILTLFPGILLMMTACFVFGFSAF